MAAKLEWDGTRRAMPRVLFQARASLFSHPGGDTVVVRRLMELFERLGAAVRFSPERGIPAGTDVVHTINFATPETTRVVAEDAERAGVPLVITTLYEEWDRFMAPSLAAAALFRQEIDRPAGQGGGLDRRALAAALTRTRSVPAAPKSRNDTAAAIARVLLCCGDSERRRVVADYPMARDVRVIPFGADVHDTEAALAPGAFSTLYSVRDFVLCVGRLETRKNQLMLLAALRDDPRPVVLVTGGFSYQPEYVRLCRASRRRGETLILDRLPSAMLAAAFREAAVHCLPSWYELPGLVSIEAASYGTRVAASSWGAIADYLDGTIAYLEPDDPDTVRRAIETACMLDPAPAMEEARAFTWERTARETLAVYEEIVPTAGATAPASVHPEVLVGDASSLAAANATPSDAAASGTPAAGSAGEALSAAARARVAGDWEAVLLHATRASADGAEYAPVAELRALALTRLGRLDEAESAFASILGAAAYRVRAETGLGIIALERGDDARARAWLERATAADADADTWAALGLCLTRLAESDGAWSAFTEARRRDPSHRTALHGLVTLAAPLERLAELEAHLRDYLVRVGDDVDVRCALAGCLYAAGRADESRRLVREVLREAPTHALGRTLTQALDGGGPALDPHAATRGYHGEAVL